MQLKEQRYVCTLARTQSISIASEELFISQPALSIYINNLEKNMGTPLFERRGKKFYLTYVGECYVEKAEQMLRLKEEFEEKLDWILHDYCGKLRIGIQTRRAPYLVAPVLAQFKKEYPKVEVEIKVGIHDRLEELYEEHKIDLILCMNTGEREDTEYRFICQERLLLALPQGHMANQYAVLVEGKHLKRLELKYLDGETFILPQTDQSLRHVIEQALTKETTKPGKTILISNIEVAMQMVAENLGVGFNREGYAKNMYYSKQVNYYMVGKPLICSDLVIGYRKNLKMTPYVARMIDLLEEQANSTL